MTTKQKSIRTSQLVSPFGAGAVVELGGESFVCMDIRSWPDTKCLPLQDNNLSRRIGREIRSPPIKEQGTAAVPFSRFPRWLFCPNCRMLVNYTRVRDEANEFKPPICNSPDCQKAGLVPMRFVAACEDGHLQDIDWYYWAHRRSQSSRTGVCAKNTARMKFLTSSESGGDFNSMSIVCECGADETFEGLTDDSGWIKCHGSQPWERGHRPCGSQNTPRAYPRGASNIYYPRTLSALDLETSDAGDTDATHTLLKNWLEENQAVKGLKQYAKTCNGSNWRDRAAKVLVAARREFGVSNEEAMNLLEKCVEGEEERATVGGGDDNSQHGILMGEWPHLARKDATSTRNMRARPYLASEKWPLGFSRIFEQVTLVDRLREVRALLGYSRVTTDTLVPADTEGASSWLPGVESFGEGIFLKFSLSHIAGWEAQLGEVYLQRSEELAQKCARWGKDPAEIYASPRFIALHTFAHGLMRRLAFDAGYSSSSLRERIYCGAMGSPVAGVLVYTSDSDAEGSLGGLVRQGDSGRLLESLVRTIADLSWCSADPVCSEMARQGLDGMNAAACHACSLVSETSCMYNNSLLDRRLLVGNESAGISGLLGDLVGTAV